MTDPDQDLLRFVAAHELVLAQQAATLIETSEDAHARLESLCEQRLLARVRLRSQLPAAYRITRDGARQTDPALPPLRPLDPVRYRHEIGITWMWLAARTGTLGEFQEILSRRQMQAADTSSRSEVLLHTPGATFNDEPARGGQRDPRDAYPDLGMVKATGGWVTLDIVLTLPDPGRLATTLAGRQQDPRMLAQLFLVEPDRQIDTLIKTTAEQTGVGDRVHVRFLAPDGIEGT